MTDADIGQTEDCQQWVRERANNVVNTLTLKNTAGNAYRLTGVGSVVIKAGANLWIGIADAGDALEVAVYADDGEPHYGLISASYDTEKETPS